MRAGRNTEIRPVALPRSAIARQLCEGEETKGHNVIKLFPPAVALAKPGCRDGSRGNRHGCAVQDVRSGVQVVRKIDGISGGFSLTSTINSTEDT